MRSGAPYFPVRTDEPLTASVIIATADRPDWLATTLASLDDCEVPPGAATIHAVVADNGSDPNTRRICNRGYARLTVEHLPVEKRGKTVAQNRAVEATEAELLVFTDDDVEFEPIWLSELVRAAGDWPDHWMFGGRITPRWPAVGCPDYLEASAYLGLLFTRLHLGSEEAPIPDFRPLGPSMAIRREAFDRGVRFDEAIGPGSDGVPMGDELDVAFQLVEMGQTAVYVPSSLVYHHVREPQLSLSWQLRRGRDYGRMTAHFDRQDAARKLFGVPRWIFRALPLRFAEAVGHLLRGRRTDAFDALMRAAFTVGRADGGADRRAVREVTGP